MWLHERAEIYVGLGSRRYFLMNDFESPLSPFRLEIDEAHKRESRELLVESRPLFIHSISPHDP